jgi:hypothetical protein
MEALVELQQCGKKERKLSDMMICSEASSETTGDREGTKAGRREPTGTGEYYLR